MMVVSYQRQTTITMSPAIKAKELKVSSQPMRVITGEAKMLRALAVAVPSAN